MPQRQIKNQRALTMIEMVVALLIVAILASIALTSYSSQRHRSVVASEARKIQRILNTARSFSLAQNGNYQVVFLLDKRTYWIDEIDASGNVIQPKIVHPEPIDENVVIPDMIVDSIVLQTGVARIRFFPQGNSSEASIYLIRRGDDPATASLYHTVKLYSPTGRAVILENQRL